MRPTVPFVLSWLECRQLSQISQLIACQSVRRVACGPRPKHRWFLLYRLSTLVACQLMCSPNNSYSPRVLFDQSCGPLFLPACRQVSRSAPTTDSKSPNVWTLTSVSVATSVLSTAFHSTLAGLLPTFSSFTTGSLSDSSDISLSASTLGNV